MNDILTKLDKAKISPLSLMPLEDRQYCEITNAEYIRVLKHNELMLTKVGELLTYEQECGFIKDKLKTKGFDYYNYSMSETISNIEKQIVEIKEHFMYLICTYFEQKYALALLDNNYRLKGINVTNCDLETIVSTILAQNSGLSFLQVGMDNLHKEFARKLSHKKMRIVGTALHIYDCVSPRTSFSMVRDFYLNDYDAKSVDLIMRIISMFHQETTNNITGVLTPRIGLFHISVDTDYEIGLEKVKAIYIYQNGKIAIKFHNKQQANEFLNFINK